MNQLTLLLSATILCAASARAGLSPVADHPEPVMSATHAAATGNRNAEVELILFREAFGLNVRARARILILPGGYECMAFVTEEQGNYRLTYLYSQDSIWWYAGPRIVRREQPPEPLPDPRNAIVLRRDVPISASLATSIIADWKRLLLRTRYETKHHPVHDGVDVTLSMEDETGDYVGHFWDPVDDLPVLQAAQAVAFRLTMSCGHDPEAKDPCIVPDLKELEQAVDELTRALDEHPQ